MFYFLLNMWIASYKLCRSWLGGCKQKGRSSLILQSRLHIPIVALLSWYRIPVRVCVYPAAVNVEESIVYRIFSSVPVHVDLHWEQLLYKPGKLTKRPKGDTLSAKFYHVAWDVHFEEYLLQNGVQKQQIIVTGNPSLALLHQMAKNRERYRRKLALDFSLNPEHSWLFFPMNYAWAFLSPEDIEYRRRLGYPEQILMEFPEYTRKCFQKFVEFIQDLAQNTSHQIIIRPHPSVTQEQYLERFYEITGATQLPSNVLITHELSAREWVVASDIVGSSWSTVAYDAFRIGKPAFLFTPYPWPDWLEVEWYKKLVGVKDFRDFQEKYKKILQHKASDEEITCHNEALDRLESFLLEKTANDMYGIPRSFREVPFRIKKLWIRKTIAALLMRAMLPYRVHRVLIPRWRSLERDYMTPQIFLPNDVENKHSVLTK